MSSATERIVERDRLTIRSERRDGVHLVQPSGEVDVGVAGLFEEEIQSAEATDAPTILLDLREVDFIDSIRIRLLLTLAERTRQAGKGLRIRRATGQVDKVIRTTGVDALLPFEC